MTKYCTNSDYGTVDNKTELEPVDDAATANWGEAWQMPSINQYNELLNSSYTTTEWTSVNGVNGIKITSKINLKSIFLPATGRFSDTSNKDVGTNGYYWSRSLKQNVNFAAFRLYIGSSVIGMDKGNGHQRSDGDSVRPVRVK